MNHLLFAIMTVFAISTAGLRAEEKPAPKPSSLLEVPLRINCGGPTVGEWVSDESLAKGGQSFTWPEGDEHDTSFVVDPAPQKVYETIRHKIDHAYVLPVPAGRYKVRIHHTDFEFAGDARRMVYFVNGVMVIEFMDPVRWADGARKVLIWDIITEVEPGKKLVIHGFKSAGNDVFQSAIEVLPVADDTPLTTEVLNRDVLAYRAKRVELKKKLARP